jgi:hypothetical protein
MELNKPKEIRHKVDSSGNILRAYWYGDVSRITLSLAKEKREREIGVINHALRRFEIKRNPKRHLFLKFNAYGMNHSLLNDQLFDSVLIEDGKNTWNVPNDWIINNGKFLNFKNNGGFELQVFIPLDAITQFKVD